MLYKQISGLGVSKVLKLKLEKILASTCRQKILLCLAKVKKTHITNLVRMTNSTYNQIIRNVEMMNREGIVNIYCCGSLKIIELQYDEPKTERLLKALQLLQEYPEN